MHVKDNVLFNKQCYEIKTMFEIFLTVKSIVELLFGNTFKVLFTSTMQVKTCAINDPLGQTHSPTSSGYCFHLKFVRDFEK